MTGVQTCALPISLQADQQELARLSSRYITHTLIPARAFLEEFERFGYGRFADGEQIFISSREKAKSFNPNATELIELKAEYVRILLVQARKSLDAFKSE